MRRPLVWLAGAIKTPPFSPQARIEAGVLLRRLQRGEHVGMPHGKPMPVLGPRCAELRIGDGPVSWRIIYRVDHDAVIIGAVFAKKTKTTPQDILTMCRTRFQLYDRVISEGR